MIEGERIYLNMLACVRLYVFAYVLMYAQAFVCAFKLLSVKT